jgi:hypothetical protein
MGTVALRAAFIWRDEVMDDLVLDKPGKITLGAAGKPTFIVPPIGLPKDFAIVRPGNRGYLLTLGENMRGTICIDGQQKDVADFVGRGGDAGGFTATPISGRDWGVIELDASGEYKLFFQFVPVEEPVPFFTKSVMIAMVAGWAISGLALATMFLIRGISTDWVMFDSSRLAEFAESAFRGFGLSTIVLAIAGLGWWMFRQDGSSQSSLAFSIVLHAALLIMTYRLYDPTDSFVWPGPRALTGNYLATRLEEQKEQKPIPTVGEKKDTGESAPKTPEPPKKVATKGATGTAGGKGDTERARDKNNKTDEIPGPPKVGMFEDKNARQFAQMMHNDSQTGLAKFMGVPSDETRKGSYGYGNGTGTGVGLGNGTGSTRGGKGKGPGGGGNYDGDIVSEGKIDTGTQRPGGGNCATPPCGHTPKPISVAVGDAEGDIEGLTAEEIRRVVASRAGVFRACYQKELNRSPGIGGKLLEHFVIGGDGTVKSAKTGGNSTFHNDAVEECVSSNIMRLHFPAKGGLSNVNFPFIFQPGG